MSIATYYNLTNGPTTQESDAYEWYHGIIIEVSGVKVKNESQLELTISLEKRSPQHIVNCSISRLEGQSLLESLHPNGIPNYIAIPSHGLWSIQLLRGTIVEAYFQNNTLQRIEVDSRLTR